MQSIGRASTIFRFYTKCVCIVGFSGGLMAQLEVRLAGGPFVAVGGRAKSLFRAKAIAVSEIMKQI